jgi:DNA-binding ferritin-like protein
MAVGGRAVFLAPNGIEIADERSHLLALSPAIARFGASAGEAIAKAAANGDPVTVDIFTEVCRNLDSQLWLPESHSPPGTQDMAPASPAVARP